MMMAWIPAVAAAATLFGGGDVSIEITDLKPGGTVYARLQTEAQFGTDDAAYSAVIEVAGDTTVIANFNGVAPGEYTASIWHDIDGDGEFDVDNYGLPIDGVANSGGPLFGPPTWEGTKITIGAEGDTLSLRIVYYSQG